MKKFTMSVRNYVRTAGLSIVAAAVLTLSACNKSLQEDLPNDDNYLSEMQVQQQAEMLERTATSNAAVEADAAKVSELANKNATQNIVQLAISNSNLSTLVAAVVKTGLVEALSNANANLTVFAPTNAAFAQLPAPFNSASGISGITDASQVAFLKNVLLYHVLGTKVFSQQIPRDPFSAVTLKPAGTGNDNTIYLSKAFNLLRVNGRTDVIADNINATNGVVHVINRVLLFPDKTIAQIALADPNFSTLVAALVKTNLVSVFTGNGDFTVFAPTNAAFAKLSAPFNNATNISHINNPAQISALANILKYHVVANRYFNWDFDVLRRLPTLAAGTNNKLVTVVGYNTGFVKGNNNPGFSQVNPGDILATNGVVHVIPNVLLP